MHEKVKPAPNTTRVRPLNQFNMALAGAVPHNRAQRRILAKPKSRPVYGVRPLIGNPICTKETYDGTAFLAQALGKPSVGPHHVRNAMKRRRKALAA